MLFFYYDAESTQTLDSSQHAADSRLSEVSHAPARSSPPTRNGGTEPRPSRQPPSDVHPHRRRTPTTRPLRRSRASLRAKGAPSSPTRPLLRAPSSPVTSVRGRGRLTGAEGKADKSLASVPAVSAAGSTRSARRLCKILGRVIVASPLKFIPRLQFDPRFSQISRKHKFAVIQRNHVHLTES